MQKIAPKKLNQVFQLINKQIAYFKFDNPEKTGSDDPGMGWYYEPEADSNDNNVSNKPAVDNSKQRKQQELSMINAFLKSAIARSKLECFPS